MRMEKEEKGRGKGRKVERKGEQVKAKRESLIKNLIKLLNSRAWTVVDNKFVHNIFDKTTVH